MGKLSTKENKNIYQRSREQAGLTRAAASEQLYMSASRIEKIENELKADETLSNTINIIKKKINPA